jgi:hypothetical protein
MKTILGIVTTLVVIAALTVAWKSFNSAQRARAAREDLSVKRTRLTADLGVVQRQIEGSNRDEAELRRALQQAQPKPEKSAVPPAPSKPAAPSQSGRDLSALMESHPELRAMFKQSFQANLGLRYLPFYRTANLSPDQIQKFETAMTEAEQDRIDLQAIAKTQGLANSDPAIAKLRQQSEEKLKAAQSEALGDAGYQQLLDYKRKEPLIGFVQGAVGLSASTPNPFTAAQAEQMLNTLASASASYQTGTAANVANVDWPKALRELQTVLPPAQFASVKANSKNGEVLLLMNKFYQQNGTTATK